MNLRRCMCPRKDHALCNRQSLALCDRAAIGNQTQCPLRVISGHFALQKSCPLYPQKRTLGRLMDPLRAMCGRLRVGKNFLHVCSLGRCSHVFGL
jgi:hypothetical protein